MFRHRPERNRNVGFEQKRRRKNSYQREYRHHCDSHWLKQGEDWDRSPQYHRRRSVRDFWKEKSGSGLLKRCSFGLFALQNCLSKKFLLATCIEQKTSVYLLSLVVEGNLGYQLVLWKFEHGPCWRSNASVNSRGRWANRWMPKASTMTKAKSAKWAGIMQTKAKAKC